MEQKNNYNESLYRRLPQLVLGFHGCDKDVADKIIESGTEELRPSKNEYDWLGNGIYFWLNDPIRAYEWAVQSSQRKGSSIKTPAVIGAVIDLGVCLDLCERDSILLVQRSYQDLVTAWEEVGFSKAPPHNRAPDKGGFDLIRPLDCAVIEHLHWMLESTDTSFDTVCGYFQEGESAFPGAGIREKSHIQICVRHIDCIKGYFLPREKH